MWRNVRYAETLSEIFGSVLSLKKDHNMNHKETLKKYLQFLEAADYENLLSLFSENAIVHSPLYGKVAAVQFYKDLFKDTSESKLTLLNLFTGEDENTAAVHFQFDWNLSDGTAAPFEVVDVCKFSTDGKFAYIHNLKRSCGSI